MTTVPLPRTNAHIFLIEGEADAAPGLRAAYCRSCGKHTLGRVLVCAHCLSRDIETRAAGQKAKVEELAVSEHPAGGYEAPYAMASVRTSEGMVLLAPLHGDPLSFKRGTCLRFVLLDHGGRAAFAYAADADHR